MYVSLSFTLSLPIWLVECRSSCVLRTIRRTTLAVHV